jgi:hypothetical protein
MKYIIVKIKYSRLTLNPVIVSPEITFWVLDAGFWILDTGFPGLSVGRCEYSFARQTGLSYSKTFNI